MTSNNTDEQGVGLEKLNVQKVKLKKSESRAAWVQLMVERISRRKDRSEGWGGREREIERGSGKTEILSNYG